MSIGFGSKEFYDAFGVSEAAEIGLGTASEADWDVCSASSSSCWVSDVTGTSASALREEENSNTIPNPFYPDTSESDMQDNNPHDFNEGRLECAVDKPQKELDGTKDAYVSYLVSTKASLPSYYPQFQTL